MADPKLNLLTEPIITVRKQDRKRAGVMLPGVLELLGEDAVSDFPALRPHQQHAWHAFLVQLAAIALHRAGKTEPKQDAASWAAMLRALTDGTDEPWCLVVDDLSKPAFMQPPVPEKTLTSEKGKKWDLVHCADELDILVTSKNHDIKAARSSRSTSEQWLFALLTLQTMQGYSGRYNHGIARMNSGYGNRPCVALAPSHSWGQRFKRDVKVLARGRGSIIEIHQYAEHGGSALLWLEPWDGATSISPKRCDPWFIEICRRVRLAGNADTIVARTTSTKSPRLSDESDAHGQTGDPWTPIEKTGVKAPKTLTVPAAGFGYNRVQELLFSGNIEHSLTQIPQPDDPSAMLFVASAMTRGPGKTEGLHQRFVAVPGRVRLMLGNTDERARLAKLAETRVTAVDKVRRKVLHIALCALLQGAREKLDFRDKEDDRWLSALDAAVDEIFFERLWRDLDLDPGDAQTSWERELLELARAQLDDAIESAPIPSARRYRAIAAAEGMFEGMARKHFTDCFKKGAMQHGTRDDDDATSAAD
ncbi:MAG: type I-E CRISPR-associated protein Cse1/CasA [Deltaproteobacteria bacterium]|nr:type I-E CRISPR-associated protein Cse1/CasA [Deltaproteobacteria bacterium]